MFTELTGTSSANVTFTFQSSHFLYFTDVQKLEHRDRNRGSVWDYPMWRVYVLFSPSPVSSLNLSGLSNPFHTWEALCCGPRDVQRRSVYSVTGTQHILNKYHIPSLWHLAFTSKIRMKRISFVGPSKTDSNHLSPFFHQCFITANA